MQDWRQCTLLLSQVFRFTNNNQHVNLRFKRSRLEYSSNSGLNEAAFSFLPQSWSSDIKLTPGPTLQEAKQACWTLLVLNSPFSPLVAFFPQTQMLLRALLLSQLSQPKRWTFYYFVFSSKNVVMHMWIYITLCLPSAVSEKNRFQT